MVAVSKVNGGKGGFPASCWVVEAMILGLDEYGSRKGFWLLDGSSAESFGEELVLTVVVRLKIPVHFRARRFKWTKVYVEERRSRAFCWYINPFHEINMSCEFTPFKVIVLHEHFRGIVSKLLA